MAVMMNVAGCDPDLLQGGRENSRIGLAHAHFPGNDHGLKMGGDGRGGETPALHYGVLGPGIIEEGIVGVKKSLCILLPSYSVGPGLDTVLIHQIPDHLRFGYGPGPDPYRFAQARQYRRHPAREVAVDGHDFLALLDPIADCSVEDETASEGDRVFFFTAAGTCIYGG